MRIRGPVNKSGGNGHHCVIIVCAVGWMTEQKYGNNEQGEKAKTILLLVSRGTNFSLTHLFEKAAKRAAPIAPMYIQYAGHKKRLPFCMIPKWICSNCGLKNRKIIWIKQNSNNPKAAIRRRELRRDLFIYLP